MPDINPFPVGVFQSVLDSFISAMKWVWTPAIFARILPFIVIVWIVGVLVFGFLALGFRAFALISDKAFAKVDDSVDWLLGWGKSSLSVRDYERMIRKGDLRYSNERTRKKDIGKIVDGM